MGCSNLSGRPGSNLPAVGRTGAATTIDWVGLAMLPAAYTRVDQRWHVNENIFRFNLAEVGTLWEANGQMAAILNPGAPGEAFLQVHPTFAPAIVLKQMVILAEAHLAQPNGEDGQGTPLYHRRLDIAAVTESGKHRRARSYGDRTWGASHCLRLGCLGARLVGEWTRISIA